LGYIAKCIRKLLVVYISFFYDLQGNKQDLHPHTIIGEPQAM